jgi:succinoglycan biosynthesis transport protein ExoP
MLPSQGYVSISRRPPDVEDYIDILRRHRAWLIGPTFAGLVIAVVVAFLWTDTFVSQAVMRITPPAVPENLVPSNFNMQMAERVNQIRQDILSRQSLAAMIQRPDLDLYKKERARKPIDDVVEEMRKNISTPMLDQQVRAAGRPASAFQIMFKYPERHKAKAVVDQLVSKFTERSVKVSANQSNITTEFLTSESKNAKDELDRVEAKLAAFRGANAGRLPEQVANNIQALNALQSQLAAETEQLNRDTQDKLMLQTTQQGLENQLASAAVMSQGGGEAVKNERLISVNREILATEARLSGLREIYKDNHPDVRNWQAQLQVLKRERDLLEKQEQSQSQDKTKPSQPLTVLAQKEQESLKLQIDHVKAELRAKDLDVKQRTDAQNRINKLLQVYQARIETSPQSEQRYAELQREQQVARAKYDEMSKKESMSVMASNLEARKAGENLEVLDPASLPDAPAEPNRWLIVGVGAGVGLLLGLFLVAAREVKDTSLKNLKDVRAYTNLPVLSSIPLLENAAIVQQHRRVAWLAWSTAVIVGVAAMSSSMYYYFVVSRT